MAKDAWLTSSSVEKRTVQATAADFFKDILRLQLAAMEKNIEYFQGETIEFAVEDMARAYAPRLAI